MKGIKSRKAQALLVYLAVTGEPAPRERLAEMFWENRSQTQSLSNLRTVLSALNKHLAPYIDKSRYSIGLDGDCPIWVDAHELDAALSSLGDKEGLLGAADVERAEAAVDLFQGEFLDGLALRGAPGFEHWMIVESERLRTLVLNGLRRLMDHHARTGEYDRGLTAGRRLLHLNPLQESVHREMMQMLAYAGQREEALEQFERCRVELERELGVAPQAKTVELFERIRDDRLDPPRDPMPVEPVQPGFLRAKTDRTAAERDLFVGRDAEVSALRAHLEQALQSRGGMAFVVGEAGAGKTSLLEAFIRSALGDHSDLVVARGLCSAYTGVGDPFQPFRDLLTMLTGDVEDQWRAGAISREHALRLWRLVPAAAEALVDGAPDLLSGLVDGRNLASRYAGHFPDRAEKVNELLMDLHAIGEASAGQGPQQTRLFRHFAQFLKAIAEQAPLLLVLDDLHWIDGSSAGLLFYLSRELHHSRILICGAYRPEEVSRPEGGQANPLASLLAEFKRQFGDAWIDLDRDKGDGGRGFVDAILDAEPNRLSDAFRQALTARTRGHPLFIVEQLRDMQSRGDIVRDESGRWVEGRRIHWDHVPVRVEGVIEKRVGLLPADMQELLKIGSVEGETFTAEVVAEVMQTDPRKLIGVLNEQVAGRHRLVREIGLTRLQESRLTHYAFHHNLYQSQLYAGLGRGERSHMHRAVAEALEIVYGDEAGRVSVQLARHFEQAGLNRKAIDYLLQAGQAALGVSANQEAITHLSRALELLQPLQSGPDKTALELELLVTRAVGFMNLKGYGDPEVGEAFSRAREICEQIGAAPQLAPVLFGLSAFYLARADYRLSTELGLQILELAPGSDDPELLKVLGHNMLTANMSMTGRFSKALEHGEHVVANYHPDQHRMLVQLAGDNLSITSGSWRMVATALQGDLETAQAIREETRAHAESLGHPNSIGFVTAYGLFLDHFARDPHALRKNSTEMLALAQENDLILHNGFGQVFQGWVRAAEESDPGGIDMIQGGLGILDQIGIRIFRPYLLSVLAEAWSRLGQPRPALDAIEKALRTAEDRGERFYMAETARLKGEILEQLERGPLESAEWYQRAEAIAREQGTHLFERRAQDSLAAV